ncbi:hypothetical protein BDZ94DRAFT_1202158 [Collybia nuda]|uniref:Protein kinase domain-containing protein n=1 Tax=Collybia nuda TaxID=64659 RepID=A0A9P5XY64_9AGAR|nr:hypothetical protein BDZ94DRAFT_1202158 [Collybia nuda]
MTTNVKEIRGSLKKELKYNAHFDAKSVFERLKVKDASLDKLIKDCAGAMNDNSDIQVAIGVLKDIASKANGAKIKSLEGEDLFSEQDPKKPVAQEKLMYSPLEKILTFMENYQAKTAGKKKYSRHFGANLGKKMTVEPHTLGFPEADPDFVCREPSTTTPADMTLWRHSAAFLEVKPSNGQGPRPQSADSGTVLSIVAQSADYARLHMSARPFQLFTVGVLIFGEEFCVGIFDRGGITFSPIHNMWKDLEIFIQVVRRISCDLSPYELGQDPTVEMLDIEDSVSKQVATILNNKPKILAKKLNQPTKYSSFPTYRVSFGGTDPRQWVTAGPPIWNSVSLIGRGTSVWKVYAIHSENGALALKEAYILKSSWRSSGRHPESAIYGSITASHPGVAKFHTGNDVKFPGNIDRLVSVDELRISTSAQDKTETKILHRLLLSTIGRPLYEYPSELHLVKAVRAAIEGHKFLHEQGILHRDISIGNVLLSDNDQPEPGAEGFITDLDFAGISEVSRTVTTEVPYSGQKNPEHRNLPATESGVRKHTKFFSEPAQRGAAMTGTVQFMACEVLNAIRNNKTIERKVQHDLESFIWVLAYAVRYRLCRDQPPKSTQVEAFKTVFGSLDMEAVYMSRAVCYSRGLNP